MINQSLLNFQHTLRVLLPETLLVLVALVMMTAGAFVRWPRRVWCITATAAILIALLFLLRGGTQIESPAAVFGFLVLGDALAYYGRLFLLLSGLILMGLAHDQVDEGRAPEFFGSLLLVFAGAMLVTTANEIVFLFVGLELVSIPTYLLLYLPRRSTASQEAVTKYFFLSIFSSALLLFGLAYLYGLTGVGNLRALSFLLEAANPGTAGGPPLAFGVIAVLFIMAGLGFRVAAVPFHFYAPDVYQGGPTIIAALLAWVPKAVGFIAMIRALTAVLIQAGPLAEKALTLASIIAVATMVLGNTVALLQDDLKRLLAYSSIAHAGYLMIGVTVAFQDPMMPAAYSGSGGILFYLAMYAVMTLGAFGVILALGDGEQPVETVGDLAGMGRTRPLLALALAICLFSLAGVPPLAGFWAKFQIFASALSASGTSARLLKYLVLIGVINAAIGAYYYLRVVVVMYLRNPASQSEAPSPRIAWPTGLSIAACAVLCLVLGFFPEPISQAAQSSALAATVRLSPQAPISSVESASNDSGWPARLDEFFAQEREENQSRQTTDEVVK